MILFRRYDRSEYTEARSVGAGILDHLMHTCAECGADLTTNNDTLIVPAALFVYPPAESSDADGYACPTCLDCAPLIARRIAESLTPADSASPQKIGAPTA